MRRVAWGRWWTRGGRLALGAWANVAGALGGAIRNKLFAHFLGTAGLGTLAQVLTAQTWAGTVAGLGLGVPLTVSIGNALARDDRDAIRRAVWTAFATIAAVVAVVGAAVIAFAPAIAHALLGPHADATAIRLSVLGIAGLAFQGSLQGLFAGRSDVRATVTYAIVGNVAACGVVAALLPAFGLPGAVFGAACFYAAAIAGTLWWHRRDYAPFFFPSPRPRVDAGIARRMLNVSLAALALSFLDQGVLMVVRTHFARVQGYDANGLLQAALALSQQVGAVFYSYLSAYAFGKVSGAADPAGIGDYTRRQATPLLAVALAGFAVAMLGAIPLLHLLFTNRFDGAAPMLAWMLFGEFAKVGMQLWVFGALPLGGMRLLFPLGATYSIAMLAGYVAATALGLGRMSVAAAYAFAGLTALVVSGVVMSRRGAGFTPRGLLVLGLGLAVLGALAALRTPR